MHTTTVTLVLTIEHEIPLHHSNVVAALLAGIENNSGASVGDVPVADDDTVPLFITAAKEIR